MTQTHQSEELSQDFPYQPLPYINFFQYPPMKSASLDEQTTLAAKLALDKPMSREGVFTIFVSIPYCRVRCHSCPFFKEFLPSHVDKQTFLDDYVDCLDIQIRKYAAMTRFSSAKCNAVYLGGGTASLLAPDQVGRIIDTLQSSFTIEPQVEITLEGNPHEFSSLEYLQRVLQSGVTRVSLGYQSSQDTILRKMLNSPHTANDSVKALQNALATGFYTVNIDLLYRLPGQTLAQWQYDLQTAIDFGPASITIYEYVIHSGSNSERLINRGILTNPTDRDT